MKKKITLLFLLLLCLGFVAYATYAANTNDKFINALRNCTPYAGSGTVPLQSMNIKSTNRIIGWNNGKCVYRETMSINGNNIRINCRFTKSQIHNITSTADAYLKTLPKNISLDSLPIEFMQNNPVSTVFNEYIQDPSTCSISTN